MPATLGARKGRPLEPEEAAFARMFWPEFMTALGRALEWPFEEFAAEREALDRDLLMYRRRAELAPFPGAPVEQDATSPFLDRCALLLDPSTMEDARVAAAQFEKELVSAAARILGQLGRPSEAKPRPKKSRKPRPAPRKPASAKKSTKAKHTKQRRRR
jgi:hypothetical protein